MEDTELYANFRINITIDYLKKIYLQLKQDLYYDTVDLFKREIFSKFESDDYFRENLQTYGKQIIDMLNGNQSNQLSYWLEEISFNFLPKFLQKPEYSSTISLYLLSE